MHQLQPADTPVATPVQCTLPAESVLQLVWLAHTCGRSLDEQVSIMVSLQSPSARLYPPGELGEHSHHCRASVILYGWPQLDQSPAATGARRCLFHLQGPALALLDADAKRERVDWGEQLTAALTSYLRTLRAQR